MGRYREKEKTKNKSIWGRRFFKKTPCRNKHREAEKVVKKAEKAPLNKKDLLTLLKKHPNFIGIFASDQLAKISIVKYPVYFIVNIDISKLPGSHWIAIRIDRSNVEIFDSLGFNPELWSFYPKIMFNFLKSYSFTHRFRISNIYQSPKNFTCGLYCIFFILYRNRFSFFDCCSKFTNKLSDNYPILKSLLLNYFR